MSRSTWKGPYLKSINLEDLSLTKPRYAKTMPRNSKIVPKFVGLSFRIHNGKSFNELIVTSNMVGYKFGEFIFTRKKFLFKKTKNNTYGSKN